MLRDSTIVFDLDGTLVDTAPDLTHALNHALAAHGRGPVSLALVRESAGRGARAMIETALRHLEHLGGLGGLGPHGTAPGEIEALLAAFLKHYGANIAVDSRPFPGALDLLTRLRTAGARLAICTNKQERFARKLLQQLEMYEFFSGLAGRDTLPVSKPDPDHVLGAIALAGGQTSFALMIGDSAVDIAAARGAGVPSLLVTYGYCPPSADGPQADASIDHFDAFETAALPLLNRLTEEARGPS